MNTRYLLLVAAMLVASSRVEANFFEDLSSTLQDVTRFSERERDYGINGRDGCVVPSPAPSAPRFPQPAEQLPDTGNICVTMLGRVDMPFGLPVGSACWVSTQFGPIFGAVGR